MTAATGGDPPRFVPPHRSHARVHPREVFGCPLSIPLYPSVLRRSTQPGSPALAVVLLGAAALPAQHGPARSGRRHAADQRQDGLQRQGLRLRRRPLPRVPGEVRQPQGRRRGALRPGPVASSTARTRTTTRAVEQLQPLANVKDAADYPFYRLLPRPGRARPGRQGAGADRGQAAARRRSSRTRPAAVSTRRPSSSPPPSPPSPPASSRRTPTPRSCRSTWNGPPAPAATWPRCGCGCCDPKERPRRRRRRSSRTNCSPRAATTASACITTASPASSCTTTSRPAGR